MNKKERERRVINIDRTPFEVIKSYCESNSLKMANWIAGVALDAIAGKEAIKKNVCGVDTIEIGTTIAYCINGVTLTKKIIDIIPVSVVNCAGEVVTINSLIFE